MNIIENVVFLNKNETASLLGSSDDFTDHFSQTDILVRGGRNIDELLEMFSRQALDWTEGEKVLIRLVLAKIEERLSDLRFKYFLKSLYIAKTTGQEEGGEVFYTRKNALIISEGRLKLSFDALYSNLSHELFHVFSKQNLKLQQLLYGLIGFKKCEGFLFPDYLKHKIITNPDGYDLYYKDLNRHSYLPIIVCENICEGGLFNSIQVLFPRIVFEEGRPIIEVDESDNMITISSEEYQDYKKEMGGEILFNEHHPDEIIADIFCYLLSYKRSVVIDDNISVKAVFRALFN